MAGYDEPKMQRYARLSTVFTPGAPVKSRDLFAGRMDQVLQITAALPQAGRHIVIYGERGVGKTSLANVLTEFMYPVGDTVLTTTRVNCNTNDDFRSIWTKVFRAADIPVPEAWMYGTPDPDEIRVLLERAPQPSVLVLDEFDRVEDDECLSLLADTIKVLSDHAVSSRLVIVGVGDSIDQLIGEHESVQRAIEEVPVQRMTESEMSDIVTNGLDAVQMTIEDSARRGAARLAEGLPHFVHILALTSAQRAVQDDRSQVTAQDVRAAVDSAIARHSLVKDYQQAIQSPRPNNLFARVLAACALADKNRLGQFTAAAVREPMSSIMGTHYDIPAFSPHLNAFLGEDRGAVLIREGVQRRYTYRFRNPLLQPFALLSAISDGLLPEGMEARLLGEDN